MARKIEITVNDVLYIGDTVPARDQLEILNIVSQNGLLMTIGKGISNVGIAAAMSTLDMNIIEKLKSLALRKGNVKRDSDGVPVAENMFQDEVYLFLLLLARVVEENVGPFWELSGDESQQEEKPISA